MFRLFFYLISSLLIFGKVHADPVKPEGVRKNNSKCSVKTTGGVYPKYQIFYKNEEKPFFSPKSDGVSGTAFSQDGKYLALTSSEVDNFGVYLVNCEKKMVKNLLKDLIVTEVEIENLKMKLNAKVYSPMDNKIITKSIKLDF